MSEIVIVDPKLYLPQTGRIVAIEDCTAREKFFRLELAQPLGHRPGQFVMVTVPGMGECAISVTCGPREDNILEMVIRKAGNITSVLHGLAVGDTVGIRGPYGSGFDLGEFHGRDVLVVAGGLGLVPLRSLLIPMIAAHHRFGNITIITGARSPAETLFRRELGQWRSKENVRIIEMVDDSEHLPWDGEVGMVTAPIGGLELDPERTMVVLCGPPVMYKFVLLELEIHHRIPAERIFVDLERRMRCGVGKCGHCQINQAYCCQDGPVFRYSDIQHYPEALA